MNYQEVSSKGTDYRRAIAKTELLVLDEPVQSNFKGEISLYELINYI